MFSVLHKTESYVFEEVEDCLLASWDESVRSESEEFLDSVKVLMRILTDSKIEKLYITSGMPMGGTLTENVIAVIEKGAPLLSIKRIALLESLDFHWDNNVLLTLNFIRQISELPTLIESFPTQATAIAWLKEAN